MIREVRFSQNTFYVRPHITLLLDWSQNINLLIEFLRRGHICSVNCLLQLQGGYTLSATLSQPGSNLSKQRIGF